MRTLLRGLSARQGISIGLLALVIAVIVVARLLPHQHAADSLISRGAPAPAGSAQATLAVPVAPLLHSPVPPANAPDQPAPGTVAMSFTRAWLHHDGLSAQQWLQGVSGYITSALNAQLAETDPANVPASRITGTATIADDTTDSCQVSVPTDTGTLVLTLRRVDTRWLVDDVDWDRG